MPDCAYDVGSIGRKFSTSLMIAKPSKRLSLNKPVGSLFSDAISAEKDARNKGEYRITT